jgi:hypothetical protein
MGYLLRALYDRHSFAPEEIYNMDETGFQLDPTKGWTFCSRGRRTVVAMSSGNREHISVIKAIAANGYSIPAFYIFKGKRKTKELIDAVVNEVTDSYLLVDD